MLSFVFDYFMEILFTLFVTIITYLYRKIYQYIKKIDVLEKTACLNLKIHIIEKYEIIKKKEFITIKEKEDIIELYNVYKKIGCSNIVDEIIKEISNIPLK